MGYQPGRFVDHEHVRILVDDLEWHLLWLERDRLALGDVELQIRAGRDNGVALDLLAVEREAAFLDQSLDVASRKSDCVRNDAVGTARRIGRGHGDRHGQL